MTQSVFVEKKVLFDLKRKLAVYNECITNKTRIIENQSKQIIALNIRVEEMKTDIDEMEEVMSLYREIKEGFTNFKEALKKYE